ncbi:MAG: hypothetical protein IJ635_06580 [Bacteroidaceae bacterium]|nr:hypothetical protein [Bacteroidaceae bacterium]
MRKISTILLFLTITFANAQIRIGGNVYGGGNAGNVGGGTSVTLRAGDLNAVFGGARMANVGGSTFVHINGAEASDYMIINKIYGGNDIAGTIGTSATVPSALTEIKRTEEDQNDQDKYDIDATWNTFVRISTKTTTDDETGEVTEADDAKKIYIGQLFGGGNGDYDYTSEKLDDGETDNPYYNLTKPELGKTYLELCGGSIVYAYGGGNNATVTGSTVICVNNPSKVVNSIKDAQGVELLTTERFRTQMGINTGFSYPSSDAFQIGRLFGGNNMAEMSIRPRWNLLHGKIRNLYSGGNKGAMTHHEGLLLEIAENSTITIDNVYGGCRMADVHPLQSGTLASGEYYDVASRDIQLSDTDDEGNPLYHFPSGLSARVLVRGGDINNVYGGNDITGNVKGGNAVGVYTSIRGDVYGGGNGSYPYTDNAALKNDDIYGDLYYTIPTGKKSVEALNDFRPNAEQVSIRVVGKEKNVNGKTQITPTIIHGSIFCGGNCATLRNNDPTKDAVAELKIGSHVIADRVFLGNNGENMIRPDILEYYAKCVDTNGDVADIGTDFSQMDLTSTTLDSNGNKEFDLYMDGVAMSIKPSVVFDGDSDSDDPTIKYKPYSSSFGSLFCGGNVGSITKSGKSTLNINREIIIYDKLVGGCNNAYVLSGDYNTNYQGGIIGVKSELNSDGLYTDAAGNIKDRLELNLAGLKIEPKRWAKDEDGNYKKDANGNHYLEWNTVDARQFDASTKKYAEVAPVTSGSGATDTDDEYRRLDSGNIYGGCCTSGIVNGNVIININASIIETDTIFDAVEKDDEAGEDKLYGNTYSITKRRSGVILDYQGMDVLGTALNVFGGGKGLETEIWGSTTINMNRGYVFQVFGGSEQGAIGKRKSTATGTYEKDDYGRYVYEYDPRYSTYVNLAGLTTGVSKAADGGTDEDLAEAEFLYGGGFEGPIAGDTHINLGNGRIFNSFAGSCNADIQGHTETYIGKDGFPYVRDYVYGGNDLGGKILGQANFASRVRDNDDNADNGNGNLTRVHGYSESNASKSDVLNASAYIEYQQGHVEKIFGGCYGVYDYTNPLYGQYFYATGGEDTTDSNKGKARTDKGYSKPFLDNAFINFRPINSNNALNTVGQIYGAGQGYFTEKEENLMQNRSYILIDVPSSMQTYQSTEIFGAGECGGVGMGVDPTILTNYKVGETTVTGQPDKASAIIDLMSGHFKNVYGGSYEEGITRRTVVNVPTGSTFRANKLFGGAYGRIDVTSTVKTDPETGKPLKDEEGNDVVVVEETPRIDVACDVYEANVNYNSADATIDEAIYGGNNACRRTLYGKVNITAPVKGGSHWTGLVNVYGAGYGVNTWSQYTEVNLESGAEVQEVYGGGENGQVLNKASVEKWKTTQTDLYTDLEKEYVDEGLASTLANSNRLYEVDHSRPEKYNTNVHIKKGATVRRYCYGGGLGSGSIPHSGNVYGTTYIDLLGGKVDYDLYAAGTSGSVKDSLGVKGDFIASATAYIEGGTARNVYGGGWRGTVGHHKGAITEPYTDDIYGETHVIIGKLNGGDFYDGIPTVERNAYGGGEGGAVFGTANITLNNGYIGYRYHSDWEDKSETTTIDERYEEKINDETSTELGTLINSGSIYGGGYIDNSNVDVSNVVMYGGHVRNALFGGGEIAAIGRGVINASGEENSVRKLQGIYKAGKTHVTLYDGYVHRNVFGGGRGYNYEGNGGTLYSDGYVFGQTEVNIFGGEVGTVKELEAGNGNVFGGGDIGYVYSAYEKDGKLCAGIKSGERYDDQREGYYYKNEGGAYENGVYTGGNWAMDGDEYILTEDCKVLVEPHCIVTSTDGVVIKTPVEGKQPEDNDYLQDVTYAPGSYVPTAALNTLKNKNDDVAIWRKLDTRGIIIHNAVFAGGNTSTGSATVYANATTVFGNATASIHDCYHRDLITIGTGHTGGLYGDGNLTFVDGYRGLNITNYGTDYYTIEDTPEISITQYHALDDREAAYYELRYKCIKACTDKEHTNYTPGGDGTKASTLSADDLLTLFADVTDGNTPLIVTNDKGEKVPNPEYWQENGVCTIYAGRIMNTIQRADFCGVFGSRMVMQGARDRVPETVDFTNYTINRVREVSLNQQHSIISSDLTQYSGTDKPENEGFENIKKAIHGNYFGIYNTVNFLGALSSDQHLTDMRLTDNTTNGEYKTDFTLDGTTHGYGTENATYYKWKQAHIADRLRNNGRSHNKVALASGVSLELTTEKSTGSDLNEKDWGYITGIVELDLINVQEGIGGGFVYAKNEHRKCTYQRKKHVTLTALNADAITRRDFTYSDEEIVEWETSGNFVHSTQTIIDDCYNRSGKYSGEDAVPAHYWYIKGQVYIYDQYISAYTGAPNAYSETVDIPLTITAASHGTMRLLDVKPNKYAFYSSPNNPLNPGQKIVINEITYYQNDPISYWDWSLLGAAEKQLFVDETYVTTANCKVGDVEVPAGTVMLPGATDGSTEGTYYAWMKKAKNATNATTPTVYHEDKKENVDFDFVFRPSNNLSHEAGYILTYKVNNPKLWDAWNTMYESSTYEKRQTDYPANVESNKGPTYRLKGTDGDVLGQRKYEVGNLIPEDIYYTYEGKSGDAQYPGIKDRITESDGVQATFEPAYIVTKQIEVTHDDNSKTHLNPGSTMSETDAASHTGSVDPAYICISTIQISSTEFIYLNAKMSLTDKNAYVALVNRRIQDILTGASITKSPEEITKMTSLTPEERAGLTDANKTKLSSLLSSRKEINDNIVPAYYCTKEGNYGGNYYESGKNYRGLAAWCSMSETDRNKFDFNYDALNLLIDSNYANAEGAKYQYDGNYTTEEEVKAGNLAGYSITQPVDYTATYNGDTPLTYKDQNDAEHYVAVGSPDLDREAFENIPNEQRHYVPIKADNTGKCYVVKVPLQIGNTPYAVGKTVSKEIYDTHQNEVVEITFDNGDNNTYYFCRESYEVGHYGEGQAVKAAISIGDVDKGTVKGTRDVVPVGFIISKDGEDDASTTDVTEHTYGYVNLVNKQTDFTIHGIAPTETSTLYVSRESDIFDLSAEKIITVIYRYDYEEGASDEITPISERHVVNIHIKFKSGVPSVEDIKVPPVIIPGDKLGLLEPNVTPGAYEVTGGGWKLFETPDDAESHINGIDYIPNNHPLYWYQDGYYLAYYAKTYLGETYSNHVQISVANYHDLKKVMSDDAKTHHYYVDNPNVKRNSKIYINDAADGLNQLKKFFDLSLLTTVPTEGDLAGHALLDEHVKSADNIEFILQTDINQAGGWEPIAQEEEECFKGSLHGDGYRISGLDHSLFGHLCGNVYNLGVTGSFTTAGVADAGGGFVENCWVKSSATALPDGESKVKAVFNHEDDDSKHIVNCYYPEGNDALYEGGAAYKIADNAFHNGTVAYNLNGFYLAKRYYDNNNSWTGEKKGYNYLVSANGTLTKQTSQYPTSIVYYPLNQTTKQYGYVESRYADGDFRYAGGSIPETAEEREITDGSNQSYYPIWPDDYLFFGQMLTYGWNENRPHEEVPTHIYKLSGRLVTSDQSNRVYRAPAYYRSKTMDVAHFNPHANLVSFSKPKNSTDTDLHPAYPDMTAIDFAGHNSDNSYKFGFNDGFFFQPLLDDDGLQSIVNRDMTPNLLVYAPARTTATEGEYANQTTYDVLTNYFKEPAYEDYWGGDPYKCVEDAPASTIYGHLVQANLTATSDHLLVDKQEFNCPIEYDFDGDHLMWYQRKPDNYVDFTKGWEGISLPFTAQLVTTDQKGEITHFYGGSNNVEGSNAKTGHEYWLREYQGKLSEEGDVFTAKFNYPDATNDTSTKEATNTFLWDYYYNGSNPSDRLPDDDHHKDANRDTYQTYYSDTRTYNHYPLLTHGTPYLIGFPGSRYYEFDLSGTFDISGAETTTASPGPERLKRQTITFASATGAKVAVSDNEQGTTDAGYLFKTNYLKQQLNGDNWTLNAQNDEGKSSFDKTPTTATDETPAVTVLPFRPYFTKPSSAASKRNHTRIAIGSTEAESQFGGEETDPTEGDTGSLTITGRKHTIIVSSSLRTEVPVRIVNVSGINLTTFTIQPGERVETHVPMTGVYIIRAAGGKYNKKISVK